MKRISDKKLAELGGKIPFSTISKKSRLKKRPRSKSEFNRIYGSKARVEFVKSLSCAACGLTGFSANAHLTPKCEKGTGYKGGYLFIAPLCDTRPMFVGDRLKGAYLGCHKLFDRHRSIFNARFPDFDPEKAAAECEAAWLAFSGATK